MGEKEKAERKEADDSREETKTMISKRVYSVAGVFAALLVATMVAYNQQHPWVAAASKKNEPVATAVADEKNSSGQEACPAGTEADGSCSKMAAVGMDGEVVKDSEDPMQAVLEDSANYGVKQVVGEHLPVETIGKIQETANYMAHMHRENEAVAVDCRNQHELCSFWSVIGECVKNAHYMETQCAPACHSCAALEYHRRCPYDFSKVENYNAFKQPGELHTVFERIVNETSPYHGRVKVLSKPGEEHPSNLTTPWVVAIDDFLTSQECDALVELGGLRGYERSRDVDHENRDEDGSFKAKESDGRTSSNTWCLDGCYSNETTQVVIQKIENLTQVQDNHSEYLQLLKYDEEQFYENHHDYIPHQLQRPQGVRVLTAYLYLNDVEEGGGTMFTDLNVTVMPKKGRVVLWPSVVDENPNHIEPLTHHQALPVEKGVKYGANAWIHLRDFKTPHAARCSG